MAGAFRNWHGKPTWCAVSALVVVLLAGEMTRPSSATWKLLVPTGSERGPVEEHEKTADEIVAAAPRQRTRCRLAARSIPTTQALPAVPSPSLSCLRFPESATHRPLSRRALPLRC
jgi:hypothetical protein